MQSPKSFGQAIPVDGLPSLAENQSVWAGCVEIRRLEKNGEVSHTFEISYPNGDDRVSQMLKEALSELTQMLSVAAAG